MEVGKVYSGKEFNKLINEPCIKITNKEMIHHGFQLKEDQVNIDINPFDPTYSCLPGGIYFARLSDIHNWIHYGDGFHVVTIPDDAKVYIEEHKMKADFLHLSKKQKFFSESDIRFVYRDEKVSQIILSVLYKLNEEDIKKIIYFKETKDPTKEQSILVVKLNSENVVYIKNVELLREIVQKDLSLMSYISSNIAVQLLKSEEELVSFIKEYPEQINKIKINFTEKDD